MLHSLILIDALSSACWAKIKKERRKKKWPRFFFFFVLGQTHLMGYAALDFCSS
jgi:hypothetical protein